MAAFVLSSKRPDFEALIKKHVKYHGDGQTEFASLDLPVSALCNIQCKFCREGLNKQERRRGNRQTVLSPREALELLDRALEIHPAIRVVGISGPGDTLATTHALDTFEFIHEKYPKISNCLSTNGLMLKENAVRIRNTGVRTVTVNVNAVQADILQDICSYIFYNGRRLTGKEGALWLLLAQLAGIKKTVDLGVAVKINTLLIPGKNDRHIGEIARVTAGVGASLIHILPFIPQYEMADIPVPGEEELNRVRREAARYLTVAGYSIPENVESFHLAGWEGELAGLLYEQPLNPSYLYY